MTKKEQVEAMRGELMILRRLEATVREAPHDAAVAEVLRAYDAWVRGQFLALRGGA